MGCASAVAGGKVVRRGGSDGKLGAGIDRTGIAGAGATTGGGRDKASATTLAAPGVWLRSVVNSEI